MVLRPHRGCGVGVLDLLHHHHRRRAYMEIRHSRLHSPHNCRRNPRLPRPLARRKRPDRPVCNDADPEQPCADVILLPVCHRRPVDSISHSGIAPQRAEPLDQSHRRARRGRHTRRGSQPPFALQHLPLLERDHARQPLGADRPRLRRENRRPRPRLHNPIQLRPGRNVLAAYPRCQGGRIGQTRQRLA